MNRYQIVHILGSAQPEGSGIAQLVSAIAGGVDPSRFEIYAWFLGPNGPLVADLKKLGISVRLMPWENGLRNPSGMWRFARQLREQRVAIVHQHFGGRALRWVAHATQGARVLVHLHGRVVESAGQSLSEPKLQFADYVIATSRAVAERVRNRPVQVVYPGVPVGEFPSRRFAHSSEDSQIVGTISRLVPLKGLVHLIRAIRLLRPACPNVRLEIAGSGPEEGRLKEEVQHLGLGNCVSFLGWQSNPAPLLARWDVFALPSLEEAFGIALVEAMADGLPVVSTNVGGIPEIVEHGRTGLLGPPGDSVLLAEHLKKLLTDPGERRRMGQAGYARARERFSRESMVFAVEEVYERLLSCRAAQSGDTSTVVA